MLTSLLQVVKNLMQVDREDGLFIYKLDASLFDNL